MDNKSILANTTNSGTAPKTSCSAFALRYGTNMNIRLLASFTFGIMVSAGLAFTGLNNGLVEMIRGAGLAASLLILLKEWDGHRKGITTLALSSLAVGSLLGSLTQYGVTAASLDLFNAGLMALFANLFYLRWNNDFLSKTFKQRFFNALHDPQTALLFNGFFHIVMPLSVLASFYVNMGFGYPQQANVPDSPNIPFWATMYAVLAASIGVLLIDYIHVLQELKTGKLHHTGKVWHAAIQFFLCTSQVMNTILGLVLSALELSKQNTPAAFGVLTGFGLIAGILTSLISPHKGYARNTAGLFNELGHATNEIPAYLPKAPLKLPKANWQALNQASYLKDKLAYFQFFMLNSIRELPRLSKVLLYPFDTMNSLLLLVNLFDFGYNIETNGLPKLIGIGVLSYFLGTPGAINKYYLKNEQKLSHYLAWVEFANSIAGNIGNVIYAMSLAFGVKVFLNNGKSVTELAAEGNLYDNTLVSFLCIMAVATLLRHEYLHAQFGNAQDQAKSTTQADARSTSLNPILVKTASDEQKASALAYYQTASSMSIASKRSIELTEIESKDIIVDVAPNPLFALKANSSRHNLLHAKTEIKHVP